MRTLKYVILGLLMKKPMTGYDITKEFNSGVVEFWSAKHSQIYPELKRLTKEGLITFETVISGEVMEKKLYSITEEGIQDFKQWLILDPEVEPFQKDLFRLKMYFSESMNKSDVLNLIKCQIDLHKRKRERLLETFKNYSFVPKPGSQEFSDYIVVKGAIMREDYYINWLELCKNSYLDE